MKEIILREKIVNAHNRSNFLFWSSVPGLTLIVYSLSNELSSGRMAKAIDALSRNERIDMAPLAWMLAYPLPFVTFWFPFEFAESSLEEMKRLLRIYLKEEGRSNPIKYNVADYVTNAIMKIAHDRSPLP